MVGVRIGMKPHTLFSEVMQVINDMQRVERDLILCLGGGSLADGAKIMSLALANGLKSIADLMRLPNSSMGPAIDNLKSSVIPIMCVPTSLSGGEYSRWGGATDDDTDQKYIWTAPIVGPAMIIFD